MAAIGWRQLPDGSWFNPFTGDLSGVDAQAEANARALSRKLHNQGLAGPGYPTPPLPQQTIVALPGRNGVQTIIDPKRNLLAVNPYELGLGADPADDAKKRTMMLVLVLVAAGGYCWLQSKTAKKAS